MRRYLAALAVLLGAMLLYQGVVLGGFLAGPAAPVEPTPSALLLTAAGAMVLAAATMGAAGVAAVELLLAGLVVMSLAGPDHRYLLAYGGAAVGLALLAAIAALRPPPPARPRQPSDRHAAPRHDRHPGPRPAGSEAVRLPVVVAARTRPMDPDQGAAHRVLRRVAAARGCRQAARQAWRNWPADPPSQQAPPPVPDAILAAAEHAAGGYAEPG